jgi:pimeloyl-[acyl-carrier protein] methyl ester esterase
MLKRIVLLPGLDGTGQLFAAFVAALPKTITVTAVTYPSDKLLPYSELLSLIKSAIPEFESFVLLAESFSAPLAVEFAASNPSNLAALVICNGFVFKPLAGWSSIAKAVAQPWLFSLNAPRRILEYFLIGREAAGPLIQGVRQVLRSVSPGVLSNRVGEALNCDARRALAKVTVPVLYVEATQDNFLARSCIDEMKRIKPDILIKSVVGPHLLLQREPQEVANIVAAFTRGLRI